MAKRKTPGWPLAESLKLRVIRYGTVLVVPLADNDKKAPNVRSILNIPYTKNQKENWLCFNWHCPKSSFKKDIPQKTPTVFYFHGGGWSSADKNMYSYFCKELAERGFNVININYRLIPEYTMEDAIDDCIKALKFCLKNAQKYGIDKRKVFLMGDSAGAHISALIAGWKTTKKVDLDCTIKGLGLYYGVYYFNNFYNHPFKLLQTYHNMFVTVKTKPGELEHFYEKYSPSSFVTKKFPPCFLTSGEVDKLHIESKSFAELLKKNKVKTSLLFFPIDRKDGRHAFLNFNVLSSHQAMTSVVNFYNKQLKTKRKQ